MRSIGQHIRARRLALGLTLEQASSLAGCTKGYLSAIETGRRRRPPSEGLLVRLERALRMEPGSLLTRVRWESTPEEIRRTLRGLERRTKAAARLAELVLREGRARGAWSEELERLATRVSAIGSDGTFQAPVINRVEDGYPEGFTDMLSPWRAAKGYVSAPEELDAESYAVRVVGDAMEPVYSAGDVVIVSPGREAVDGSDCFVRLRGSASEFCRVYFTGDWPRGGVRLQPINSVHPPRHAPGPEVLGLDVAVYVMRRAPGREREAGREAGSEAGAERGPEARQEAGRDGGAAVGQERTGGE